MGRPRAGPLRHRAGIRRHGRRILPRELSVCALRRRILGCCNGLGIREKERRLPAAAPGPQRRQGAAVLSDLPVAHGPNGSGDRAVFSRSGVVLPRGDIIPRRARSGASAGERILIDLVYGPDAGQIRRDDVRLGPDDVPLQWIATGIRDADGGRILSESEPDHLPDASRHDGL